jgi:hypothetical protein
MGEEGWKEFKRGIGKEQTGSNFEGVLDLKFH